ncbi:MAG: hypothetical protein RIE58_11020 [Vicingaceae bacterium]
MRKIISFLLLWLLSQGATLSQNRNVVLDIDTNDIPLGGQIQAELRLEFPATEFASLPVFKDTIVKEIEIVSIGKIDSTFTGPGLTTRLLTIPMTLTSFDTGYHAIPPLYFTVNGDSVKTEPILIHVSGVRVEMNQSSDTGQVEIKDIKDIRHVPFSLLEWIKENWVYLLIILLVIIGIWAFFKYIKPMLKKDTGPVITLKKEIPLHVLYLERLQKLSSEKLWQSGKVKEYQSSLSNIIRGYIEEKYGIPALESTTGEIIEDLSDQRFNQIQVEHLTHLLNLADLVKFAKHQPLPDEHELGLRRATEFIKSTVTESASSTTNLAESNV